MEKKQKDSRFESALYKDIAPTWPTRGRHILAQHDDEAILVYQAYKPSIGHYAAVHKKFEGAPGWKSGRMTWVKTNFLWMMYRSGWGSKSDQEVTLGIWIKHEFFEELLRQSCATSYLPERHASLEEWKADRNRAEVRIQWDPDHHPDGSKMLRRAIQIGVKGKLQERFASGEMFADIVDLSDFVAKSHGVTDWDFLEVAKETVFTLKDADLAEKIGLTGDDGPDEDK